MQCCAVKHERKYRQSKSFLNAHRFNYVNFLLFRSIKHCCLNTDHFSYPLSKRMLFHHRVCARILSVGGSGSTNSKQFSSHLCLMHDPLFIKTVKNGENKSLFELLFVLSEFPHSHVTSSTRPESQAFEIIEQKFV